MDHFFRYFIVEFVAVSRALGVGWGGVDGWVVGSGKNALRMGMGWGGGVGGSWGRGKTHLGWGWGGVDGWVGRGVGEKRTSQPPQKHPEAHF